MFEKNIHVSHDIRQATQMMTMNGDYSRVPGSNTKCSAITKRNRTTLRQNNKFTQDSPTGNEKTLVCSLEVEKVCITQLDDPLHNESETASRKHTILQTIMTCLINITTCSLRPLCGELMGVENKRFDIKMI